MSDDGMMKAVFDATKQIESILENKFGARGTGLHKKALSVEAHLGQGLLKKIQFLATIRNKLAHESDFTDVPYERFMITKQQVLAALEALDEGDFSSLPPSVDSYLPTRPQLAKIRFAAGIFIGVIVAGFIFSARSRPKEVEVMGSKMGETSETETAASAPKAPLWSVEHPDSAKEAFPWRAEQAAFIAAGETGILPNETLWQTTSAPREVKIAGKRLIEFDITLGGGQTTGKLRLPIEDTKVNPIAASIELKVKTPKGADPSGMVWDAEGNAFDSFKSPLSCQREIAGGCERWLDHGVSYVAVSLVSFKNSLKIVYGAQ